MNGVISASVSAGSSQRVASVTWTANVTVPAGWARTGDARRMTRATERRMCSQRTIAPPSTCPWCVRLNDAVAAKRLHLRVAVAEQLAVDLCVVLAEERGAHHVGGGIGQTHGVGRHGIRAAPGMLEVDDEAALAEVLVLEHLGGVEHSPARHARAGEDLQRLVLGALRGPRLDLGVDVVHDGDAIAPVRVARIVA